MSDGRESSEYGLARIVAVLGAVLAGATVTLGSLKETFPDVGWIGVLAGVVAMAASVLGYAKSRGQVKAADVIADAAKAIAGVAGTAAGMAMLKPPPPPGSISTLQIPTTVEGKNVPPNP